MRAAQRLMDEKWSLLKWQELLGRAHLIIMMMRYSCLAPRASHTGPSDFSIPYLLLTQKLTQRGIRTGAAELQAIDNIANRHAIETGAY